MAAMASQITSLTIVSSTVYSGADQRKHQSSVSMAFVQGIHRRLVNSPHTWPVTRTMFPFDDFIMSFPDVTKVFDEVSLPRYPRATFIVNCHTNVDLWLILTCSALRITMFCWFMLWAGSIESLTSETRDNINKRSEICFNWKFWNFAKLLPRKTSTLPTFPSLSLTWFAHNLSRFIGRKTRQVQPIFCETSVSGRFLYHRVINHVQSPCLHDIWSLIVLLHHYVAI